MPGAQIAQVFPGDRVLLVVVLHDRLQGHGQHHCLAAHVHVAEVLLHLWVLAQENFLEKVRDQLLLAMKNQLHALVNIHPLPS